LGLIANTEVFKVTVSLLKIVKLGLVTCVIWSSE